MKRRSRNSAARLGKFTTGALVAMAFCGAAQAACPQWNLNGDWNIVQSNDTVAPFRFHQEGKFLKGTAAVSHTYEEDCIGVGCDTHVESDTATVDGEINGDSIEFTAYWSKGPIGHYEGTINDRGRLKGTGYERRAPDTIVSWYSRENANCIATSSDALTVEEPGTIKAGGRVKTGTPGPALEICEAARKAAKRNSPAAPGLRQKCLDAGGGEATSETTED